MEYSPFACAASTTFKVLNNAQGIAPTTIHSLHHQQPVVAVCTIYRMHCSIEHHCLEVSLHVTHRPNLETYYFTVIGSNSEDTLPDSIVDISTPHGQQQS